MLDSRGHHLASVCSYGGKRIATHDGMKYEFNNILRYCGLHTKMEERGAFQELDPNNNMRPDISVFNPTFTTAPKQLLDIAVTGTLTGFNTNGHQLQNIGSSAQHMYNNKINHYAPHVIPNRFSFLPIIFESSGYMHADVKDLLLKVATLASDIKRIPKQVLYKYFLKRLSLCLQCGVAYAINSRILSLNSHCDGMKHDASYHRNIVLDSHVKC